MIVVFGSLTVDLITPVEHLPSRGETVIGGSYSLVAGGKGANQALAAALGGDDGQRVAMVGTIGGDAWGDAAPEHLRVAGVDLSLVAKGRGHTACGFISVDERGQTQITVSPGANMETRAGALDRLQPALGPRDWLMLQMEVPLAENWRALERAKSAGAKCVLNLAPAMPVEARALSMLDYLVVNEPEAELLGRHLDLPGDHLLIARVMARRFGLICIATLGAKGSVAFDRGSRSWRVAALDISASDTTGAGDAYVGYLVAALDRGAALPEAMRFASAGASLSCETRGAQTAYRRRDEIERRMRVLAPAERIAD